MTLRVLLRCSVDFTAFLCVIIAIYQPISIRIYDDDDNNDDDDDYDDMTMYVGVRRCTQVYV